MFNVIRSLTITFSICLLISSTYAEDLMQVYQDALQNDQTYQQAISTWQSAKENLHIARALYLPSIQTEYNYSQKNQRTDNADKHTDTSNASIALTQQIFNVAAWMGIKESSYSVKAATATYFAAQQSLMESTASAYFDVMIAAETVIYDKAYKRELYNQLVTNQQKYKVGLISSVDVYTTEASYDAQAAQLIADQNTLRDNIEALAVMTNHRYKTLQGIKSSIPLLTPKPNNLDQWVKLAIKQNYTLQSQQYITLAAKQDIRVEAGGATPTVFGTAAALHDWAAPDNKSKDSNTLALTVDYYPFQGGLVYANTRQARYDYVTQTGALEYQYRQTVQNTRNSFLGVNANISKVKADQQGVISAQRSLEATQAGYQVGTQDIEDVLSSISQLYSSKQTHVSDQYAYLGQLIELQESAGTLSTESLQTISNWLKKKIIFSELLKIDSQSNPTSQPSFSANKSQHSQIAKASSTLETARTKNIYTIQLFASHKESDAQRYISNIKQPNAFITQTGNWYKVAYGHFNSQALANDALKKLPSSYQGAWVTKLAINKTFNNEHNNRISNS
ncbi:MAG: hypothetical protein CL816_02525 [Coxiellaceae bacterium]|nr:hypothetical protein [Coxiellaceae bacterium]|tara:strand:+ start:1113 stop:2804 length:1692 start_codon:yes stop_codon:yes gene_type:complete